MASEIYWIDKASAPKLAIMARPRAGDWLRDEVINWKNSGVKIVISLLEQNEVDDLGLEMESSLCEEHSIAFYSFPIPDRGVPKDDQAVKQFIMSIANKGLPIAVHCRAGIGRSSLMAAAIIVERGGTPTDALLAIQKARRLQIPDTDEQREWVLALQ
jgi:protein-tyrosine phosphatase